MSRIFLVLIVLVLCAAPLFAEVKEADLAGGWYPENGMMLGGQLDSYLEKASPPAVDGKVIALIAPHAGYTYSGPVAAYAFKTLKSLNIKTVIVVGFSHRKNYNGIALLDADGFRTPLGLIEIDKEITGELIAKHEKIYNYSIAFSGENSVEMELPFIQTVLKDSKVVLVALGRQSLENCKILGEALYEVLKDRENVMIVASTDMSHHLSYESANTLDARTISEIKKFDPKGLYEYSLARRHGIMCGIGAVCATMIASEKLGADKIKVLKYANSGDATGDKKSVVGYLSAAIVKSGGNPKKGEKNMLNEAQRKRLLDIARQTMEAYIKTGKTMDFKEEDPLFNKDLGAFVTLHKNGQLRGCIGNIIGRGPLYLTVRDMAIQSSTSDPRFSPVSASELADVDIEISVLSELEKIDDPYTIEMGKHGVLVKSGFRSGVFSSAGCHRNRLVQGRIYEQSLHPKSRIAPGCLEDGQLRNLCVHSGSLR